MATISTSIELHDRLTTTVSRMVGSLGNLNSAFDSVESSMNGGFSNGIDKSAQKQDKLNDELKEGVHAADNLTNSVMGLVGAYLSFQGIQKLVNLSDEYTQTNARLNMIVDDLNTVEELQAKIYASAQRSRGVYTDTADLVAKLSLRTGKLFTNDEAILFAENLNKLYTIAGASQQEMKSSQLQLTQALGSGVLRGEEFNAVFEAAPNVMQTVADYMNVPIGSLREMAKEGQITGAIVKNALLGATNDINSQFETMPMTWGQVWNGVMNQLYMASMPILEVINWMAQHWSTLEPIVLGVATAIGIYTAALLTYNTVKTISTLIDAVHAAALKMSTGATFAATAAQYGFNAALLACPLTWILLIIIAVIAAIYAVVAAINKATGSTISATGVIVGALMTAAAFIWNLIVGLLNGIIQFMWTNFVEPYIGIIEWILNVCNGGFNSFGDAVANLIGQIISWFLSLGKVVTTIIDAIFGTNWTAGLNSLQDKVLAWGKNENAITLSREAPSLADAGVDRWAYGDAYDLGYSWGEGIGDKVSSVFGGGNSYLEGQIPTDIAAIADNTGDIKDAMDITSEDLKYLRDLAETEIVNRFTTAEIKVEMTNNNSIASDMDLDGIVDYLVIGVNDAMEKAAEGVH